MNITILGSGDVGRTLAAGLAGRGHRVTVGSRTPQRQDLRDWATANDVGVSSSSDAAGAAEVVFLATAWEGAENALRLAGVSNLAGTTLVDVTNPLQFTDRLELAIGHTDSGGEQVQRWAPDANVVKAFNTVGFELMIDPEIDDGPPTMFLAGDDAGAKTTVSSLAQQLGWHVHDCGDLRAARLTEPLALLWIQHALGTGSRGHAFRMLSSASSS